MEEFEIQQLGIYCDTVYMIMKNHCDLSVMKAAFFAYAINKSRFFSHDVYNARHKADIVCKEVSVINGDFDGFIEILPYILKAIHILNCAHVIEVSDGFIHLGQESMNVVNCNDESAFTKKAIEASKNWSEMRFIKEVLHNV